MSFTKEVYMKTVEAIVEYSDKNLSAYIDGAPIAVVGDSISEIEKNMREAVSLYVESCKELGIPVADMQLSDFQCGVTGNRTRDTRIFSPLLYQLSYDTISLYFFRVISSSNIASSVGHYRKVTPSILARSSRTHLEINYKFQSTFG